MSTRLTRGEVKELKQLKREILSSIEATAGLIKSAKDKARQALAEAMLCGKALLRVKKIVGYGNFQKWLKVECETLVFRTAQRYMQLATHMSHQAITDSGLRRAYIALGIVDETTDDDTTQDTTGPKNALGKPLVMIKKGSGHSVTTTDNLTSFHTPTTATPQISKDDALSRPKFLMSELLSDLESKITSKVLTLTAIESATLKPLQDFIDSHRQSNRPKSKR